MSKHRAASSRGRRAPAAAPAAVLKQPAQVWFLALGLLLAFLVYLPALRYEFVFDDWEQIAENTSLRDSSYWWKAFGQDLWHFRLPDPSGPGVDSQYYRPLFALLLWAEYQLFGLHPTGYHAVSLVLHLVAVLLVYALARRIFGVGAAAGVAALLFAVHPIHVESVAWPSASVDLLLAPSFLGALLLHSRHLERDGFPAGLRCWILALLLFAVALLTKETALLLPLIVLMLELQHATSGRRAKRLALALLPYGIVGLAYMALRLRVLGIIARAQENTGTWVETILTLPSVLVRYTSMALLWFPLGPGHPVRFVGSVLDPRFLVPLLVLALLAAAAAWLIRLDQRRCGLGLALFLVPLLPPLYLRGLYSETLVQDRYLYLPSVGAALILAWLLRPAAAGGVLPLSRPLAAGLALGLTGLATLAILHQLPIWRDEVALFSRAAQQAPDSGLYQHRLGLALQRAGNLPAALTHLERVVQLPGADWVDYANLAQLYLNLGRYPESAAAYQRSLDLAEQHPKVRSDPRRARLALYQGEAYERLGADAQAIQSYARALVIDPALVAAFDGMARAAIHGKIPERGQMEVARALQRGPWSAPGATTLALLLLYLGRLDQAGAVLQEALERAPQYAVAQLYWAQILLRRGDLAGATAAAERALALQPDLPAARALLQELIARGQMKNGDR